MTDNDTPPIWALDKAAQAATYKSWDHLLMYYDGGNTILMSVRAHAALISKYEKELVDPDLAEARECAALTYEDSGLGEIAAVVRQAQVGHSVAVKAVMIRLQREKEGKRVGS